MRSSAHSGPDPHPSRPQSCPSPCLQTENSAGSTRRVVISVCHQLVRRAATSASCLRWLALFGHGRPNRRRRGGMGAGSPAFPALSTEPMRHQIAPQSVLLETQLDSHVVDPRGVQGGGMFPERATVGCGVSSWNDRDAREDRTVRCRGGCDFQHDRRRSGGFYRISQPLQWVIRDPLGALS